MGILDRFGTIIKANINDLLDKMEDPSKLIEQHLIELRKDLAEVKKETAGVMAEEQRAKRRFEENQAQVQKYTDFAKAALSAGNDNDARVFIAKSRSWSRPARRSIPPMPWRRKTPPKCARCTTSWLPISTA